MKKQIFTISLLFLLVHLLPIQVFGKEIISDSPTIYSYYNALLENEESTFYSGRVWTDKTVYANPTNGSTSLSIDSKSVNYSEDFLEVYSALGSTQGIGESKKKPIDLVINLDCSISMAETIDDVPYDSSLGRAPTRIDQTVSTLNALFNLLSNDNSENRLALVFYSTDAQVILPLDNYYSIDGKDFIEVEFSEGNFARSFKLNVNVSNKDNEISEVYVTKPGNVTNYQAALDTGSGILINNSSTGKEEHRPKMITLTDGVCNSIYLSSWENLTDEPLDEYIEDAQSAVILETLLNAAYNRTIIDSLYTNAFENIIIGIDIDENNPSIDSLFNASSYLLEDDEPEGVLKKEVYKYFRSWNEDQDQTLYAANEEIEIPVNQFPTRNVFNIKKEDLINSLNFVNYFNVTTSNELNSILFNLASQFTYQEFRPVHETESNILDLEGSITYFEPIGDYMEIRSLKEIFLYGKRYPFTEVSRESNGSKTSINYIPTTKLGEDLEISNGGYENLVTFHLSDIKVRIESENGKQNLIINIPEVALPVIKTTVNLDTKYDENNQKIINSLQDNRNSDYSNPLRILYGVSLVDSVKNDDGTVNLEALSEEYKATHLKKDQVDFFVTEYDPKAAVLSVSDTLDNGKAYSTFIPSSDNSYYVTLNHKQIYSDESLGTPITGDTEIKENKNYFIEKNYYKNIDKTPQLITDSYSLTGNDLLNYIALENPEDETSAILLQAGSNQQGDLSKYSQTKLANETNTSSLAYSPYTDTNSSHYVQTYLGNNGKLTLTVRSNIYTLDITKYQAIGENSLTKDKLTVSVNSTILNYALDCVNLSEGSVKNALVIDEVPEGLTVIESSISHNGILEGNVITWHLDLEAGETVRLTYSTLIPKVDSGYWRNVATISFDNHGQNTTKTSNIVEASKDSPYVVIEKYQSINDSSRTKARQTVSSGDKVTYIFEITNKGLQSATNVLVADEIPDELKLIASSISDNGVQIGKEVHWNFDELKPGETKTVEFSVSVPTITKNSNWKNIGFVNHEEIATPKESNEVEIEKVISNLSIFKTQSSQNNPDPTKEIIKVQENEIITYYLTVSNTGAAAIDITITDVIPEGLEYVQNSASSNGVVENNIITWYLDSLGYNQSTVLSFSATVKDTTKSTWSNTAVLLNDDDNIYSNTVTSNLLLEFPSEDTTTITQDKETIVKTTTINSVSPKTGIDPKFEPIMFFIIIAGSALLILQLYRGYNARYK